MPNWAYVDYVVTGKSEKLDILYQTMKELQELNDSFMENDFGTTWLGNLVAKLGGDPTKIYCRGKWTFLERNENEVVISMETAWGEPNEVRSLIEEKIPGLKVYFNSTTDDSWYTNDKEGKFFNDRYYLYTDERGSEFVSDLYELISRIKNITGTSNLCTLEECKEEVERHSKQKELENEFYLAYIGEYQIVD